MKEIGFDPETDKAWYSSDTIDNNIIDHPLFWADDKDNVCIGFMHLHGEMVTYDESKSKDRKKIKPYHVKRLKKPILVKGKLTKYLPCTTGFSVIPYLPREIVELYNRAKKGDKKAKLKKLVITEGQIKAYVASKNGFPIIGIPGITIWKPKNGKGIFHQIKDIVEMLDVKEVIFLTDADTLEVTWEEGKDLTKRPWQFYYAVRAFKNHCDSLGVNMYFAHFHKKNEQKGIDDLILASKKTEIKKIKAEVLNINSAGQYLAKHDMERTSWKELQKIFFLFDTPREFYTEYESTIKLNPFIYDRAVWQYNDNLRELECKRSKFASAYVRIQDTNYRKSIKPNEHGINESILIPVNAETIKVDCGYNTAHYKQLMSQIDFYHSSINLPEHLNYQESISLTDENGIITRWYNWYRPLTHSPAPGDFSTTIKFLKHIFGTGTIEHNGKSYNQYELGLDYLKLQYCKPKHFLPILCLVSEKGKTGKTTYWDYEKLIFQGNLKKVKAEHLAKGFNSFYITALKVIIEEAFIEKKATVEKLKELVTSTTQLMDGKFQNIVETNSYIKVGISSNNVNDFAKIGQDETRFWPIKVPVIPKEDMDVNLLEKLAKEIPAFLYFLIEREYSTKRETRAWFADELISTEVLKSVKKASRWDALIEVEDCLKDHMETIGKTVLRYSSNDIVELVGNKTLTKGFVNKICAQLKVEKRSSNFYKIYTYKVIEDPFANEDKIEISERSKKSGHYIFPATKFYSHAEIIKLFTIKEILEFEKFLKSNHEPNILTDVTTEDMKQNPEIAELFSTVVDEKGLKALHTFSDNQLTRTGKLCDYMDAMNKLFNSIN